MERAVMRERLEQAEQQVSDCERQVARLLDMIADITRQGHDVQLAMNMLHRFEQALASIANRDRLRKALGL
jgi:chromosome segregation ATPase